MTTEHYDYIIIGSGFGGAVAAHKLIQSGAKVLLLERGPWRDTQPVRGQGIQQRQPFPTGRHFFTHLARNLSAPLLPKNGLSLNRNGLYEIHYGKDMSVICTSGVGGGSQAYSAMNTRPDVANYWQDALGKAAGDRMDAHYQWMIDLLGAKPPRAEEQIPNFIGEQLRDSTGFIVDPEQQPPMSIKREPLLNPFQNTSLFGSQSGAKSSLDHMLIAPAMRNGLEVLAQHECLALHQRKDASDYRVDVFDHSNNRYRFLLARRVIVAAGTLNTLKLLYRSRDLGGLRGMPALGFGFSGNGDFPAMWDNNREGRDLTQGTPCHGRFALKDYPDCPNFISAGANGVDQLPLPQWLKRRLRKAWFIVAMGADDANGHVSWHKGRLRIQYIRYRNAIMQRIISAFDELARRSGSKVYYTSNHLVTVHPLGGARCGKDSNQSVVNLKGEIHDNPGVFVVDAAALPAAPGSPPSMSVAAWSAHVCEGLLHHAHATTKHRAKVEEAAT